MSKGTKGADVSALNAPTRALAVVENLRDELEILRKLSAFAFDSEDTDDEERSEQCEAVKEKKAELQSAIKDLDKVIRDTTKMFNGLEPRQMRILHMVYIQGLTIAQAAERVGIGYTTAAHDHKAAIDALAEQGVI